MAAADSRGTFGDPRGVTAQNDSQQKVHLVSAHAAVLLAGSGELGTQLVTEIREAVSQKKLDGATDVLHEVRNTARLRYGEWFPHLRPMGVPGTPEIGRPDLLFVVAGYDRDAAGAYTVPRLYSSPSALDFPPMLHAHGFVLQGVAQYALYLLNRLYEADRTLADLTSLAVYVITETASQDGKVGGPVRAVTIHPDSNGKSTPGVDLPESEVKKIHESNAERANALRKSFYTSAEAPTNV